MELRIEGTKSRREQAQERLPLWQQIIDDSAAPQELKRRLHEIFTDYISGPEPNFDRTWQLRTRLGVIGEKEYLSESFPEQDAKALFANLYDDVTDLISELYDQKPDSANRLVGPGKNF